MKNVVLARRLRPQTFSQVVGHDTILSSLKSSLDSKEIHHAFLLTGTRGVGKTTIARILAKSLNCVEGVSSTPCGKCDNCLKISTGTHEDVIEVDAASRTKVEDTRELIDTVGFLPSSSRFKVYLIDEVHMLSTHSFNAILKTVEEPPEHVIFIFATTEPKKLPVTLVSRCMRIHLRNLSVAKIKENLISILEQERVSFEQQALEVLSVSANGSVRDSLSLLQALLPAAKENSLSLELVRNYLGLPEQAMVVNALLAIIKDDKASLADTWQQLSNSGADYNFVLSEMQKLIYEASLIQEKINSDTLEYPKNELDKIATSAYPEQLQVYYQMTVDSAAEMASTSNLQIAFQMLCLRMLCFQRLPDSVESSGGAFGSSTVAGNNSISAPIASSEITSNPSSKQEINYTKPKSNNRQVFHGNNHGSDKVINKPNIEPNKPSSKLSAGARDSAVTSSDNSDSSDKPLALKWAQVLNKLDLSGLAKIMAQHCEAIAWNNERIDLELNKDQAPLLNDKQKERLKESLQSFLGLDNLELNINIAGSVNQNTPAASIAKDKQKRQKQEEDNFSKDPLLQKLLEDGGKVDSIVLNEEEK